LTIIMQDVSSSRKGFAKAPPGGWQRLLSSITSVCKRASAPSCLADAAAAVSTALITVESAVHAQLCEEPEEEASSGGNCDGGLKCSNDRAMVRAQLSLLL
jgi:hypothetical protein